MICERILLATDFSKRANSLIDTVKKLKLTGLKEVVLIHVINIERHYRCIVKKYRFTNSIKSN
ncbi:hypothetical protein MWH28_10780 [Natroniella sulfidigena]|uniref:hypothetical protein n=1 Tax=Natroniella sulfidigena TaxID=723921 RepID=UPI00200B6D40|nr:hypothetical protein [Natroniella sulfidigena]MCK8817847.1 hypothetical protein [Natroniella sulfidigena]